MYSLLLVALIASPVLEYDAQILECYDGDTCTFDVMQGFGSKLTLDIRFCEVDTPELPSAEGVKAKHFTYGMLSKAKNIRLVVPQKDPCSEPNRCEKKSFDRVMAWVLADGVNMTDALVSSGNGEAYTKKKCGGRP